MTDAAGEAYSAEYDLDGGRWALNGFPPAGQDHSTWMLTFVRLGGTRCKTVFPKAKAGTDRLPTKVTVEGTSLAHEMVMASPAVGIRLK